MNNEELKIKNEEFSDVLIIYFLPLIDYLFIIFNFSFLIFHY